LARRDRPGTLRPLRDEPVGAVIAGDAAASQNGAEREEEQEIYEQSMTGSRRHKEQQEKNMYC
jgi:hypothetical protein